MAMEFSSVFLVKSQNQVKYPVKEKKRVCCPWILILYNNNTFLRKQNVHSQHCFPILNKQIPRAFSLNPGHATTLTSSVLNVQKAKGLRKASCQCATTNLEK